MSASQSVITAIIADDSGLQQLRNYRWRWGCTATDDTTAGIIKLDTCDPNRGEDRERWVSAWSTSEQ
jgi:hypothetical protein